ACTNELKRRFALLSNWQVEQGSVLDESYVRSVGGFDVVYSWGVLHHTGDLWKALEVISIPVTEMFAVAIYNDQGLRSRLWWRLKKLHCKSPRPIKFLLEVFTFMLTWGKAFLLKPVSASRNWRSYAQNRGMSPWRDVIDWAGGFPYEVAKPG